MVSDNTINRAELLARARRELLEQRLRQRPAGSQPVDSAAGTGAQVGAHAAAASATAPIPRRSNPHTPAPPRNRPHPPHTPKPPRPPAPPRLPRL